MLIMTKIAIRLDWTYGRTRTNLFCVNYFVPIQPVLLPPKQKCSIEYSLLMYVKLASAPLEASTPPPIFNCSYKTIFFLGGGYIFS